MVKRVSCKQKKWCSYTNFNQVKMYYRFNGKRETSTNSKSALKVVNRFCDFEQNDV